MTRSLTGLEGLERLLGKPVTFLLGQFQRIGPGGSSTHGENGIVTVALPHAVVDGALGHATRAHVPCGVWSISSTDESSR